MAETTPLLNAGDAARILQDYVRQLRSGDRPDPEGMATTLETIGKTIDSLANRLDKLGEEDV